MMNKRIGALIALAVLGTAVNVAAADYKQMIQEDIARFQRYIASDKIKIPKARRSQIPMYQEDIETNEKKIEAARAALRQGESKTDYDAYKEKLINLDSESEKRIRELYPAGKYYR